MVLIALFLNFLMSLVLPHIRSPVARKVLNTSLGICMTTYTYGIQTVMYVAYSMIAYVCFMVVPRQHCVTVGVAAIGLTFLVNRLYIVIEGIHEINVGSVALITFVKQMQILINYRDGNGDIDSWLTKREKHYALKGVPSFLDYCSYMFNLQSSVIGPSFEYKDWEDFINLRGHYADMKPFASYPYAFQRLLAAIVWLVAAIGLGTYYP